MTVGVTRTRLELRNEFFKEADTDSDVISDPDVDELIHAAGVQLAWFLVRRPDSRHMYSSATRNTVATNPAITLPDNCIKVIAMKYTDGNGNRREIFEGTLENLDATGTNDSRDWNNSQVKYIFTGDTVEFDPVPEKVYEVKIHFIPSLPFRTAAGALLERMTADTDVVEMPYEWHRYLTLTAVRMWMARRREDASDIKDQINDWATIIQDTLDLNRQVGHSLDVRDVVGHGEHWHDYAQRIRFS